MSLRSESRLTYTPPLNPIVLAGDPDHDVRLILLSALTHAGYRVRLANTGEELLREALADGVALILSELHLQAANGRWAIEALKRMAEAKRIPVIAYSETGARGDEALAHTEGADAFLRDPTNLAALLDTVASMISGKRLETSPRRTSKPAARTPLRA